MVRNEYLIPLDQAVKFYGVSRSTLFEYLRRKRVHRIKQNGDRRTFLDRRELDRFFEPAIV